MQADLFLHTPTGHVEQQHFSDLTFRTQQRSFNVKGYAADPSILREGGAVGAVVGDVHKAFQQGNDLSGEVRPSRAAIRAQKRKRKAKGELGQFDSEDEEEEEAVEGAEGEGEMEEVVGEDGETKLVPVPRKKKEKVQREYIGPWAGWEGEKIETVQPTFEEYEEQEAAGGAPLNKKQRKAVIKDSGAKEVGFGEEKSVFHGAFRACSQLQLACADVQSPSILRQGPSRLPRPVLPSHPYRRRCQSQALRARAARVLPPEEGHPHLVRPHQGHLQDSALPRLWSPRSLWLDGYKGQGALRAPSSFDEPLGTDAVPRQLWDVYGEGKCLRTFMGHSKAVHDVTFDSTGAQFLSSAFDRQMKLWDTETGT